MMTESTANLTERMEPTNERNNESSTTEGNKNTEQVDLSLGELVSSAEDFHRGIV